MIGTVLQGRYRVEKKLGSGGHGEVYRGADLKFDGAPVAIKVLRSAGESLEATSVSAFRKEALLAKRFEHPNAVRVIDYGPEPGVNEVPYLVLEFLEGQSLNEIAHELTAADLRTFVAEVASALQNAHANHLVHRDLKPQNIMLVDRGTPKQRFVILDFGIASKSDASRTLRNQTADGLGTPLYMSPEQVRGRPVDARSDIYSFGTILYELLTGTVPFTELDETGASKTLHALWTEIVNDLPAPLSARSPRWPISVEVEQLILQCLSKDARDRPASMAEVSERFLKSFGPDWAAGVPPGQRAGAEPDDDLQTPLKLQKGAAYQAASATQYKTLERNPQQDLDATRPPTRAPAPVSAETIAQEAAGQRTAPVQPLAPESPNPASRETPGNTLWQTQDETPREGVRPESPGTLAPSILKYPGTLMPGEQPTLRPLEGTVPDDRVPHGAVLPLHPPAPPSSRTRSTAGRWVGLLVVVGVALIASIPYVHSLKLDADVRQQIVEGRFAEAFQQVESLGILTARFVDRNSLREAVRDAWRARALDLLKERNVPETITVCKGLLAAFPGDTVAGETLRATANEVQTQFREQAAAGNYQAALILLDSEPVTALIGVDAGLFNRTSLRDEFRHAARERLRKLADAGQNADLARESERLLEAFPDDATAAAFLPLARGALEFEQKHDAEAVAQFTTALEKEPDEKGRLPIYLRRGQAHLRMGHGKGSPETLASLTAAIADFTQVLSRQPSPEAKRSRATAYFRRAKSQETSDLRLAICDCRSALADDPGMPEAEEMLEEIAGASNGRGDAFAEKKEYEPAIAEYSKSILAKPDVPEMYLIRGDMYYYRQPSDYAAAVADYKQYLHLITNSNPDDLKPAARGYHRLAWIKSTCPIKELRDGETAAKYADNAIRLIPEDDPEHKHALAALAAAYAEQGKFAEAAEWELTLLNHLVKYRDAGFEALHKEQILPLYKDKKPYRMPAAEGPPAPAVPVFICPEKR